MVVGVDGAGRTHRLTQLAPSSASQIVRPTPATVHGLLAAEDPLVVDDAHRLDPAVLDALADAAAAGRRIVVARRPSLRSPHLAALDDALAARGDVEQLPAPGAVARTPPTTPAACPAGPVTRTPSAPAPSAGSRSSRRRPRRWCGS